MRFWFKSASRENLLHLCKKHNVRPSAYVRVTILINIGIKRLKERINDKKSNWRAIGV